MERIERQKRLDIHTLYSFKSSH